jgi:hypothetical protein
MLNQMHVQAEMRDREREIRQRIRDRRQRNQLALQSQSVRRAVGRSIVEIGHRIAAEPQPRLARSR